MKNGFYFLGLCICLCLWASCSSMEEVRDYNEKYTGEYTSRIAFPIGGLGTGMFCVEGSGAISNMNIRHKTEMLNEPTMFAGLYLKGVDNCCGRTSTGLEKIWPTTVNKRIRRHVGITSI